jgi:glycosyltransferase involved in cell wall biosynthesis
MAVKVCFIGGARYSQPLDATSEKKFRVMKSLGELYVIGFSRDLYPRRFTEHAFFYLLPAFPLAVLRYIEMFVVGSVVACWLIFWHRVQIFVAQSPYEGLAAAVAKKIAGYLGYRVVLVVENHGDFEESLFMQRRIMFRGLYSFLMRRSANFALKRADLLRAVSNSTREQLEKRVSHKVIFQFVAWTDIEAFLHVGAERRGKASQNILYAGVLIPRKGIHHLVNAFACIARDFPQACLIIAGLAENKSYAAQLKAQTREADLNGRVEFVDEMPQVKLAARMQEACAFVLPSYSEGLPRVVYEAMAVGLPVIASGISGIPDIVQDGVTGFLVQPGDEAALAEKIRWILEHPEESYAMGQRGRISAERVFSTETYLHAYREVFQAAQALITNRSEHAPSPV